MEEELIRMGIEEGFAQTVIIPADRLVFRAEYRKFCEENRCGNYEANYACPPFCGTVEKMQERTLPYGRVLVLRSDWEVDDAMDASQAFPKKQQHNRQTLSLSRKISAMQQHKDALIIAAGPCNLCGNCFMLEGRECPHPKERFSCLSAYCIDVMELATSCGMELSWDMGHISYFSLVLFGKR